MRVVRGRGSKNKRRGIPTIEFLLAETPSSAKSLVVEYADFGMKLEMEFHRDDAYPKDVSYHISLQQLLDVDAVICWVPLSATAEIRFGLANLGMPAGCRLRLPDQRKC